jgi:hypothetical protein
MWTTNFVDPDSSRQRAGRDALVSWWRQRESLELFDARNGFIWARSACLLL